MTATDAIVARCEAEEISPAVALMELLIATEDADAVRSVVAAVAHRSQPAKQLAHLFAVHEEGCRRVAAMLQADVDRPPQGSSVEEGVAFCRSLFDWSVQQSEAASVALYSLGSAELLAAATAEIVAELRAYGLLASSRTALDLGCGTGRIAEALAGDLAHIHGIDVSPAMIEAAQRRCAHLPNVRLEVCSGLDLTAFSSESFDMVLAVDSFPYVVQSGWELAVRMFDEAARVLRGGGELVIFNFSYRGDRTRDQADALELARRSRFHVLANGKLPFRLWNGDAYRMRKG